MSSVLQPDAAVLRARSSWRYRGGERPPFAEPVGPGEESVWDFPRPPRLEGVTSRLRVLDGETVIAETTDGMRVLETAGAPTYYFPPGDVATDRLVSLPGRSLCEWKGIAESFSLSVGGEPMAWCYPATFPEFVTIQDWFAFYPSRLACFIGDERVAPQPGGYYGGWVTRNLRGPIKGGPGTGAW